MAKAPITPINEALLDDNSKLRPIWLSWFNIKHKQSGGGSGLDVYPRFYVEKTITAAELDGALSKTLIAAKTGASYKVRDIFLSGAGTSFGAGGDRTLSIQDSSGTVVYSVLPNSVLESLTAARWGDTEVPFPSTASHLLTASTSGEALVATYTGGTTDHSTGSLTLMLVVEKIS